MGSSSEDLACRRNRNDLTSPLAYLEVPLIVGFVYIGSKMAAMVRSCRIRIEMKKSVYLAAKLIFRLESDPEMLFNRVTMKSQCFECWKQSKTAQNFAKFRSSEKISFYR